MKVILFSQSRDVKESFVDCEKYEASVLTLSCVLGNLKSSSPFAQEIASGPVNEPDKCSPHHSI